MKPCCLEFKRYMKIAMLEARYCTICKSPLECGASWEEPKPEYCECGNILGWESLSQGFKKCRWCRSKPKKVEFPAWRYDQMNDRWINGMGDTYERKT